MSSVRIRTVVAAAVVARPTGTPSPRRPTGPGQLAAPQGRWTANGRTPLRLAGSAPTLACPPEGLTP